METEAAGAVARAGQLAEDQENGLGLRQLGEFRNLAWLLTVLTLLQLLSEAVLQLS